MTGHHGTVKGGERTTTAGSPDLAAAFDLLPDPALVLDRDGLVLLANEPAHHLLGLPHGALVGRPHTAFLDPQEAGAASGGTATSVLATKLAGPARVRTAQDELVAVHVSARDARLEAGRAGVVLTLRETRSTTRAPVTREQTDTPIATANGNDIGALFEALQRNEERLYHATMTAQVGLFDHSVMETDPPWWSPSMRALLGLEPDHEVDFAWFQERVHPEDAPLLGAAMEAAHAGSGDGSVSVEYRWHHPTKGLRWLLVRSTTVFSEDAGQRVPVRSHGAIIDVTDQREAEEDRKRRIEILEETPDFVAITDLEGGLTYLNRAGRNLMGLTTDASLAGHNVDAAHSPEAADRLHREAIPTAKHAGTWRGEANLIGHDGTLVPVSQIVLAHRSSTGEVAYLSTVARDLTKERRLEEQFRHAQKMEAIGRLAGGVAHDFNNLLSVILAYAELGAADRKEDERLQLALGEITQAAQRAASLTRQLLAFSRRQILQPRVLNINQALTEFSSMVTRLVDENVEVQVIPANVPTRVRADPTQLHQVLLNLAVNARDAMPKGGALTVEAFQTTLDDPEMSQRLELQAGTYAVIAVSDTGHGMDEATRKQIFEPFFTTKGPTEGTGLGLATVLGIVRQSGGSVWVYSEPGRGTTFKVYFPCTNASVEEPEAPAPPLVLVPQTGVVLVAEDDPQVRNMVGNLLMRAGFEVISAAHPEQAQKLAAAHEGEIDLLLSDVVMPGLSGPALAERLRETRPGMAVLFTSGYTESTIVDRGVLAEGVDFLPKPITPGRLISTIGDILSRRQKPGAPG